MSKMSIEPGRHALNGPVMGTRWTALFQADPGFDPAPVQAALQAAVDEVDNQMSIWKPASDLTQLNAAAVGIWQPVPAHLLAVLALGLAVGRASGGAFDIGLGDAVAAWGFGPGAAIPDLIRAAMDAPRLSAQDLLELDPGAGRVRKTGPITVDLNGIAKGYGTDRLAETLTGFGIRAALVGIDGEMRALGTGPGGTPWTIAVEAPEPDRRAPQSVLSLQDAAVATSGDYRHWVEVAGHRLSHTINPVDRAPVANPPASVTVVAATCALADAWATALMVLGTRAGAEMAQARGIDALFLSREDGAKVTALGIGRIFGTGGPGGA